MRYRNNLRASRCAVPISSANWDMVAPQSTMIPNWGRRSATTKNSIILSYKHGPISVDMFGPNFRRVAMSCYPFPQKIHILVKNLHIKSPQLEVATTVTVYLATLFFNSTQDYGCYCKQIRMIESLWGHWWTAPDQLTYTPHSRKSKC